MGVEEVAPTVTVLDGMVAWLSSGQETRLGVSPSTPPTSRSSSFYKVSYVRVKTFAYVEKTHDDDEEINVNTEIHTHEVFYTVVNPWMGSL